MKRLSGTTREISDRVLYLAMLLFPMPVFRVGSILIATMLMALYVLMVILKKKKLYLDRLGISFLLVSVITLFSAFISEMGNSWKMHAFSQFGQYVLLLLFYAIARKSFQKNEINVAVSGLKDSCKANLILCFIQAITWYAFRVDFNDRVFNQLLHLQEDASKMRFGHVAVSGFGWHPAQLIPILVLSYYMFDSSPIKVAVVIVALLTSNFTCTLAVMLCVAFSIINRALSVRKTNKFAKREMAITGVLLIGVIVVIVLNSNVIGGAINNARFNFNRIQYAVTGNYESGSTMKHSRYYLAYPEVVSFTAFFQNIFGYGIDCSGYPYSRLFAQYTDKSSWHVESDVINILVGRGWIWAIMFYSFLATIAIKGHKLSRKYALYIITMVVLGIFYDCQGKWTMYLEMLMFVAIKRGIDIFNPEQYGLIHEQNREETDNRRRWGGQPALPSTITGREL